MEYLDICRFDRFPFNHVCSTIMALCMYSASSSCAASTGANHGVLLMNDQALRALKQSQHLWRIAFHMQAPGPDFVRQMRSAILRDYPRMD